MNNAFGVVVVVVVVGGGGGGGGMGVRGGGGLVSWIYVLPLLFKDKIR